MFGLEFVVIMLAVILVCAVIARRIRIAAPIVLLAAGVLLGFAPALRDVHLPPELMLLVFLPALLWWESINTSLRGIRANFRGILLSATLLVVATAAAVALVAHLLGVPWGPAWVLGAAVAPTDATAVGAMARSLPRRSVTVLRAESLVNDGTALVLYGVAVGVTVGEQTLSVGGLTWLFLLSYGGGILVGVIVAWLGVFVRKRLHEVIHGAVVFLLLPFAAFLGAELIGASGVLSVVVCGLIMTQIGPRISDAATRRMSVSFWTLTTFLINAALFVLIGIEAQSDVRDLVTTDIMTAIVGVVVVWAVILVVRFAFLVISAYTIRMIDRRPSQRQRRVTNRARVVSTLAGFRGAVSLAAALAVPATLGNGDPFPSRDIIVFVTAGVVAMTLVVQGLLLPVAVRWAHFPDDDAPVQERQFASRAATEAGLDALPEVAGQLGTSDEVVERVRADFEEHLRVLNAEDGDEEDADATLANEEQYQQLRLALLQRKRETIVRLRDEGRIDDDVLRDMQAKLDIEEVRLNRATPDS